MDMTEWKGRAEFMYRPFQNKEERAVVADGIAAGDWFRFSILFCLNYAEICLLINSKYLTSSIIWWPIFKFTSCPYPTTFHGATSACTTNYQSALLLLHMAFPMCWPCISGGSPHTHLLCGLGATSFSMCLFRPLLCQSTGAESLLAILSLN